MAPILGEPFIWRVVERVRQARTLTKIVIATSRDPRDWEDWKTEFMLPTRSRLRVVANYVYENSPLVRRGVQRTDVVYTAAKCLIHHERVRFFVRHGCSLYDLQYSARRRIDPDIARS